MLSILWRFFQLNSLSVCRQIETEFPFFKSFFQFPKKKKKKLKLWIHLECIFLQFFDWWAIERILMHAHSYTRYVLCLWIYVYRIEEPVNWLSTKAVHFLFSTYSALDDIHRTYAHYCCLCLALYFSYKCIQHFVCIYKHALSLFHLLSFSLSLYECMCVCVCGFVSFSVSFSRIQSRI